MEQYRSSGRERILVKYDIFILFSAQNWQTYVPAQEDYLIWRVLCSFFPDHSADRARHRENCLKDTESLFVPAVTAMYVRAKGAEETSRTVKRVDAVVTAMKEAFRRNLPALRWMSQASAREAEKKLVKKTAHLGSHFQAQPSISPPFIYLISGGDR